MHGLAALWRRVRSLARVESAADMHLGFGALITFLVRICSYALIAATGIIIARALGPYGRGIYGVVVTTSLLFVSFSTLGIGKASVYLVGQRKFTLQQVTSNSLAWFLTITLAWFGVMFLLRILSFPPKLGQLDYTYLTITLMGGSFLLFLSLGKDLLLIRGNILGFNAAEIAEPLARLAAMLGAMVLIGLRITAALSAWLFGIFMAVLITAFLLGRLVRLQPGLNTKLLRAQLSFGLRDQMGWVLQAANNRLDVFVVAAFLGVEALGVYAVAFGVAELLWQIPLALAVVLYPKSAALGPEANALTAAITCRRTLFLTALATAGLFAVGRFLLIGLYGHEFLPGLTALYILLPSGLFYTIHKTLGSALAGRGMPQASFYGGMVSFPVTVALDFLLIPRIGIEGAALASTLAYVINAAVILALFLKVTRVPPQRVLFVDRTDLALTVATARRLLARPAAAEAVLLQKPLPLSDSDPPTMS